MNTMNTDRGLVRIAIKAIQSTQDQGEAFDQVLKASGGELSDPEIEAVVSQAVEALTAPQETPWIRVTFTVYSAVLKKSFTNVELHRSLADANLRALALNWQIAKVEAI